MARKMNPNEFYKIYGKRISCNEERAQFVYQTLIDLMVEELLLYGIFFLPNVGTVFSKTRGGKIVHVPISANPEDRGKIKEVYVDPYQCPSMKFSEYFKDTINGRRATRKQIMRQRELYRKLEIEEEERLKQSEYVKRASLAFEEMNEKNAKAAQKRKMYRKASKKKLKELERKENSYWEDFEEE